MLALTHALALFNMDPVRMEKGRAKPRAVVNDDEPAFEAEPRHCEHNHTISGRDKGRARRPRNIDARMVAAWFALIDPLAPKAPRYPPRDRPDEVLLPALSIGFLCARGNDGVVFGLSLAPIGLRIAQLPTRDIDALNLPIALGQGERFIHAFAAR